MQSFGCSLYSFGFVNAPTFLLFLKLAIGKMVQNNISHFELPLWDTFSLKDARQVQWNLDSRVNCYSVHMPKTIQVKSLISNKDFINGVKCLNPSIAVLHPQSTPEFQKDCLRFSQVLEDIGCQLCVEFLAYEQYANALFEFIPGSIGIALDFYHCACAGISIKHTADYYASRIMHVHLNDFLSPEKKAACPGEGFLQLDKYFQLLNNMGYNGKYMLECGINNDEQLHNALCYCHNLLNKG